MTDDEARDRFSDAIEGDLKGDDAVAFEAALEKSEELREEYESFRAMMRGSAKIAEHTEAEVDDEAPEILSAVQDRLHKRSKGRFYRDRFSRDSGRRSSTLLITIVVALTLAAAALALQNLVVIEDAPAPPSTLSPTLAPAPAPAPAPALAPAPAPALPPSETPES